MSPVSGTRLGRYEVLSGRELHSRYEVAVEQYITTINIEAETAASIARTMLLPAAATERNRRRVNMPRIIGQT